MKAKLVTLFLLSTTLAYSQVGINTNNPQAIFHIDGLNDNNSSSSITSAQQSNDFVVTKNGNVGIGIINPEKKLEINTGGTIETPTIGVKIVDGNQGKGKVLMSDENGSAT